MFNQQVTRKFPTLERLALNRVREKFPGLQRKGFSTAVRRHLATEGEVRRGSVGIIPDGWFEDQKGTFICVEIEDGHPLTPEKLWLYCDLWATLDACDVGYLHLLVFDRYGHNQRELDLCALYVDGVIEKAAMRRLQQEAHHHVD